jgi:hypothetical protein
MGNMGRDLEGCCCCCCCCCIKFDFFSLKFVDFEGLRAFQRVRGWEGAVMGMELRRGDEFGGRVI